MTWYDIAVYEYAMYKASTVVLHVSFTLFMSSGTVCNPGCGVSYTVDAGMNSVFVCGSLVY